MSLPFAALPASAENSKFTFVSIGGGGTVGSGQTFATTRTETGELNRSESLDVEGGAVGFFDAVMYNPEEDVTVLWQLESALRLMGGAAFSPTSPEGFGGGELRANGDIGITLWGVLPINQAIEDSKLRITNRGVEGKTLIGTSHVVPLDELFKCSKTDRIFFFSLTHGFRYHSGLGGWTWALYPKFQFIHSKWADLHMGYLFGFWSKNRREHSGRLGVEFYIGEHVRIDLFSEVEYLIKSGAREKTLGWSGNLDVAWHYKER